MDASGAYTAPQEPGSYTVIAADPSNNSEIGSAVVRVISALLSWTPSSSVARSHRVYRSSQAGGPYELIGDMPSAVGLTYLDKNVASGATYFYVVSSVNSAGLESAYSNEVSVTMP